MITCENTPITLTIGKLLDATDRYVIPLYQRNYAWTYVENTQLLKDIEDKLADDPGNNYFIGTIVVFRKPDTTFEIIDGQQRLTTLSLVHAVIKSMSGDRFKNARSNLAFESRKETGDFISKLFYDYANAKALENVTKHSGLLNIVKAVKDIECYLTALRNRRAQAFDDLVMYLYNHVKVIRVAVPDGTDINRYFEIMNNRGEQLEFHEILKASFLANIKNDALKKEFDLVWNACSQMNRHIQMCFPKERRKEVFGANYDRIPMNFIVAEKHSETGETRETRETREKNHPDSLINIIDAHVVESDFSQDTKDQREGNYESVIDFSNFLLHVLKLQRSDVSLDDKKLLDEFGYNSSQKNRMPDAISFVNKLLYYRTLFDKYVIKRGEGTEDWKYCILSPHAGIDGMVVYHQTRLAQNMVTDPNNDSDDLDNLDENSLSQSYDNLCMIQSMLHVTYPNKSYKLWLYELMSMWELAPAATGIIKALNDTCVKNYRNVIQYGIDSGTSTERFIFNYLDYILWVKYRLLKSGNSRGVSKLSAKINNKIALFDSFKFRQNNSVEHLHPQSKEAELHILALEDTHDQATLDISLDRKKILNCFGNLCLISRESNSKYNDYNIQAKSEQFDKKKYVESLKQVIMFGYDKTWNTSQILEHRKEMIGLIEEYAKDPESFMAASVAASL